MEEAERTIIISSRELVDHAVLTRKRNELQFKRDLLAKSGAKDGDLHLKAIDEEIASVESKLSPIGKKLAAADMLTLVPARKEIAELTQKINGFSRSELEQAVKSKSGEAYELMKKRAALTKSNYERREDIARLTILLNTLPRKDGEALRSLIEENSGPDVDVSFLPKEKQQELVNLASRLGRQCCVFAGSFSLDKKKVDGAELKPADEVRRTVGGRTVWVDAKRLAEFEENERLIAQLLAKIQAKAAEKQSRKLTEEEAVYFEKIQSDYLSALQKRSELVGGFELNETAKVYRKQQPE
ncbi:MAG: hypothetical protein N3F07_03585 [Candidatus Micrarchaeota archaeon]|nr:hypothetical protein [Candidatus Micrarchaeota archaeon]